MPGNRLSRRDKGRKAEDRACRFLEDRGIKVLARNYYGRRGELDIIGREGNELRVVEVRSRDTGSDRTPEASISPTKARRISLTASRFIQRHKLFNVPVRLDLIVIDFETGALKFYPGGIIPFPPA
ncbi:MAG TPA: YraN family protein [bacterium]|nr:YraN family protein [bacterium]